MKNDLEVKIKSILENGPQISEDQVRSLMILIRKSIELLGDPDKQRYLILNLFCNWCAHTKIDQSNTGLRILAKVNDALFEVKNSQDSFETQSKLSQAIGYVSLRKELISFLNNTNLIGYLEVNTPGNDLWGHILTHLLEIIRDVPLEFPSISDLDETKKNIYKQIIKNAIKPGWGVLSMKIEKIDYSQLKSPFTGELLSLRIGFDGNRNTIVVPLLLNIALI